jgi:uncharacterized protein YyaL (SSP411 family)
MRTRPFLSILLAGASACITERGPFTNRMAHSATSYLARAAGQPVNWQPWGREAFALAAKLDRPVLLYVGGDACRWCAETDRAIYTDPEIGALINALFVPVRVDRDERPDVAQRYQASVATMAGLRGWPLTVFLTPDGAAFFGGTYFPADDPLTGRGLKQVLPEVAKSYRDRRAFIVQHAALVRQLALAGSGVGRGVLRPDHIQPEVAAVRAALDAAVRTRAALGSVMHAEAASLLISEFARTGDSASLVVARRALDLLIDSAAAASGPPEGAPEDPPRLVRAALLRGLAKGWIVTGEARYRDAGRALAKSLARELAGPGDRPVFADQEGYVIEAVILSAATLGDAPAERRARGALDALLQRMYARGWGVRHAVAGSAQVGGVGGEGGLLQDQVQVAGACVAAYQVGGDARYLVVARDLATVLEASYADPLGGYFDAASADPAAPALADRTKQVFDDILPGANAWTARVLLRLAEATGDAVYRRRAEAALEAFAGGVDGAGVRAATFLGVAREVLASRAARPSPPR